MRQSGKYEIKPLTWDFEISNISTQLFLNNHQEIVGSFCSESVHMNTLQETNSYYTFLLTTQACSTSLLKLRVYIQNLK